MVFNMKFVSDGLQTVSVMKIELRISPVHLYLVTPSDKSFLLWKRILWRIIWFSIWKWPFIEYDSCDSMGAPAPFHFIVGFSDRRRDRLISILYKGNNPIGKTRVLTFCRESESLGSLWITRDVFIRETRLHPSQLYMLISGFMIVGQPWIQFYSSRTTSQPGITALPRITAD